jgi:hypothetical protein
LFFNIDIRRHANQILNAMEESLSTPRARGMRNVMLWLKHRGGVGKSVMPPLETDYSSLLPRHVQTGKQAAKMRDGLNPANKNRAEWQPNTHHQDYSYFPRPPHEEIPLSELQNPSMVTS